MDLYNIAIAKALSGNSGGSSGSGLPSVTSADIGKGLSVQDNDGTAEWTLDPYVGYDVVITIDLSDSGSVPELVKGDFAQAVDKLTNGVPLNGAYFGFNSNDYQNSKSFIYAFAYNDYDNLIVVSIHEYIDNNNFGIIWKSDNTIEWGD